MKKNIVILGIIIIVGIVSIIFFNRDDQDYYLNYANKIVDLYNGNKDTKGIKDKDLKAFEDFYKKLKHQDEMLDITEYFEFNNSNKISGEKATKAVYSNNKCFIKYDDLTLWDNRSKSEEGDAIFQRVTCNGYETLLFETMFMPPYETIIKDDKYNYVIDSYTDSFNGYMFKYKSTYDDTDLTLKLIVQDDVIQKVEVSYD